MINKCPIKAHDSANAKFSSNWDETDYSDRHANVASEPFQA